MIVPGGVDTVRLRTLVLAELKKAGLKHRTKKTALKNVKDSNAIFGAPLAAVALRAVNCCGSSLNIPAIVVDLCTEIRENAHVEGIFRKAGSSTRQKDIKRILDCGGSVTAMSIHPVDVASMLKLYLRALPEPVVSFDVQELLLHCRLGHGDKTSEEQLSHLLNTLMLLPVLNLHLLHYVMELLNVVAARCKDNLMDATNLAIVMTPNVMPLPTSTTSAQRLQHHVALVKIFIENSKQIGSISESFLSQLEGEEVCSDPARRKKRRSGSLNRVLNGLRKIVGGGDRPPPTPIRDFSSAHTPVISKSAAKRKLDANEGLGLSTKIKKEIKKNLAQKEIIFTPMKMSIAERKKLRLSMMDTALVGEDLACESSASSENLVNSSDHLFTTDSTIDLSDSKPTDKDYVKIPKQEFEEIKSRVSAIESRLSKEWTNDIPVQPLKQVQDVYEQTLEGAAALDYSSSEQLANRLSKELNIRPSNQNRVMRSPSARKIGSIRRRSKENVPKLVRHKSWNVPSTQANHENFYPYVGLKRGRPNAVASGLPDRKNKWKNDRSSEENSFNRKIQLIRRQSARDSKQCQDNSELSDESNATYKWRNAATYFMERTGEADNIALSGRPSVNRLRNQNAGAVLAKARMFESSSDRSSELPSSKSSTSFARKPRVSGSYLKTKPVAPPVIKVKPNSARIVEEDLSVVDSSKSNLDYDLRKVKKSPLTSQFTYPGPSIKKLPVIKSPRGVRTPQGTEARRLVTPTPLRATHTSPLRRSPRLKNQRPRL